MITVCTTLAAFAMDQEDTWGGWLRNIHAIQATRDVRVFAAIETDARGMDPFTPLLDALRGCGGEWWDFRLDDGRTKVTTANRLRHLTMGQNLAAEYSAAAGASHMLFCAADCAPPPDVLPALLDLSAAIQGRGEPEPMVGPEITTYCLHGDPQPDLPWPVHEQLISAACVLIPRAVFKRLRWRCDPDTGETDDPSYRRDALELLGVHSYVRKDIHARHYPEAVGAIETRGHDMEVHR